MFKFSINNYRGFLEEEFDFRKINILIGENSSGKSSILKLMLALRQSLERPNDRELNIAFSGDYTDLGSYKDVVYENDDNKNISFSFEFGKDFYQYFIDQFVEDDDNDDESGGLDYEGAALPTEEQFDHLLKGPVTDPTFINFELTKEVDRHASVVTSIVNPSVGQVLITHVVLDSVHGDKIIFVENKKCNIRFHDYSDGSIYDLANIDFDKEAFFTLIRAASLRSAIAAYKVEKEKIDTLFWRLAFLLVAQNYARNFILKIQFLNPINSRVQRFYFDRDRKATTNIKDFESLVAYFTKINVPDVVLSDFNNILKEFGIAEDIRINRDSQLPVREFKVKVKDLWSNILDVGYGVALQLPILFQAFLSEMHPVKGQTLIIEQPEVHLHPRLQAKFIETIVNMGQNNVYFIETHSEHIIRKLQVLVKENVNGLTPDDVSIHYLRREQGRSVKTAHEISEKGILKPNFPSGFFDNSYLLAKELVD